jgi:hypothetical protein
MHLQLIELLRKLEQDQTGLEATSLRIDRERQLEIEEQIPRLIWRHTMLRNALLAVEISGIVFVLDMFVIASSQLLPSIPSLVTTILVGFLLGVALLLVGLLFSINEVYHSHRDIMYEVTHGFQLSKQKPL